MAQTEKQPTTRPAPTPPRTRPTFKKPKQSFGRWFSEIGWRHVVGILAVVWALFPVSYIISASLNPLGTVVSTSMIPNAFSLDNYEKLLTTDSTPFLRWALNSLIVCTIVVFVQLLFSALAAFAFSRFRFKGRRGGLLALLLIQMFPQFLAAVALFTLFTEHRRGDPADRPQHDPGLHPGHVRWRARPGVADQGLLRLDPALARRSRDDRRCQPRAGLLPDHPAADHGRSSPSAACWSSSARSRSSCWPASSCTDNNKKTLATGLYGLLDGDRSNNLGVFAAGGVMTAIPVVLLFLYLQRFIVGGITAGGVKG